jgi:hypothetical protein
MRRLVLSGITVGALLVGVLGVPAGASNGFRVVKVDSISTSSPATLLGTPTCDPVGHCLVSYTVTAQLTGGQQGTLVNDGTLWLENGFSTFDAEIIGLFSGHVDGCGTGTMAVSFPFTVASSQPFSGRDEVVPGSGTGDLTGISGSGTYTFDPSTGASEGTAQLKCRAA